MGEPSASQERRRNDAERPRSNQDRGRSIASFQPSGEDCDCRRLGRQLVSIISESADEKYKWLNNTFCVVEGKIDLEKLVMNFRVFSCISDLP
jgi:hypothetical protein